MTTMAQAIRQFLVDSASPQGVTSSDIRRHISDTYPGRWEPTTLTAHLYGCRVNSSGAYWHHRSADKFLFKDDAGRFHLYNETLHGPNVWMPVLDEEGDDGPAQSDQALEELIETSISFERDVEEHLIRNLEGVERGLKFMGRQVSIDVGRVDILAEDASGNRVVIELKIGAAKEAAVGQIAKYLGWYARQDGKAPRGLLIAGDFPEPIRYAAEAVKGLQLVRFKVQFAFALVSIDE